ncbi:uncharacterized protein LOC142765042 [Rhipicephalus microplus]|uniref:uncharacterized protein LOC142765042 n=1 Tax=Rhipicephalus microplus TaxID=6941 RepID=UPI003F6B8C78
MAMRPPYTCLFLLVFISYVYALPKWGPSKKPPVYRPTYCMTLPFNNNCKPLAPLWYYNAKLKTCVPISAGYHVEGANKFASFRKCSEVCHTHSKVILKQCLTPPTITSGSGLKFAWYFDDQTKFCKMFTFFTCKNSNSNFFASELKCESVCLPRMKPAPHCSADPIKDVCLFQRKHYYFNFRNNTCMEFPKKGCGKGPNSFTSMVKCMDRCSYNQSTTACLNCAPQHPNELPPFGKPTEPNISEPVTPPIPSVPSSPLNPQVPQGTPSVIVSPGNQTLPSRPTTPGKPSSTFPVSVARPNPHVPSSQQIPAGGPVSSGIPISQTTNSSTFPGGPVRPISSVQSNQPTHNPIGGPVRPGKATSPKLNSRASRPKPAAFPLRAGFH